VNSSSELDGTSSSTAIFPLIEDIDYDMDTAEYELYQDYVDEDEIEDDKVKTAAPPKSKDLDPLRFDDDNDFYYIDDDDVYFRLQHGKGFHNLVYTYFIKHINPASNINYNKAITKMISMCIYKKS
jgi:hypothetical protein